jgi:hypothetical protein
MDLSKSEAEILAQWEKIIADWREESAKAATN